MLAHLKTLLLPNSLSQSVRGQSHLTRSLFLSIYEGIKALYWQVAKLCALLLSSHSKLRSLRLTGKTDSGSCEASGCSTVTTSQFLALLLWTSFYSLTLGLGLPSKQHSPPLLTNCPITIVASIHTDVVGMMIQTWPAHTRCNLITNI